MPVDLDPAERLVAELVEQVKADPRRRDELVELLPERHPVYAGRGANTVVRLRGYLTAAFEHVGLPPAAIPFVLDELQNGRDAYLVAAAAKAVRGLDQPAAEIVPYLLAAVENVRHADDTLSFEGFRPERPYSSPTTAMAELSRTLAWMESVPVTLGTKPARRLRDPELAAPGPVPGEVVFEDQAGRRVTALDYFRGALVVVVFFYTRCENPNKCSLTITRLGELQRDLAGAGLLDRVRTAAVTYDPGFDLPARLLAYGENRGVTFADGHRFLRATSGFDQLQDFFELGVSYGPALVNRHRIELFVVGRDGRVAHTLARLQWEPAEVLDLLRPLIEA